MDTEVMAPELWSRLPCEIHDLLLVFLTVPVQCRFRTVCKRWDGVVKSARFRALCVEHADAQGYILGRVAKEIDHGNAQFSRPLGWRLLDVRANRWYWLARDDDESAFEPRSLALHNGLACAFHCDPAAGLPRVRITHPIAKVMTRLPVSPYSAFPPIVDHLSQRLPFLTTLVTSHSPNSQTFIKLFVISTTLHETEGKIPSVAVYDSKSESWSTSRTNLTYDRDELWHPRSRIVVRCMMYHEGLLYVVITNPKPSDSNGFWQLWRWTQEGDEWGMVARIENFHAFYQILYPQMVVSDGRLFLVTWVSRVVATSHVVTFDVIEVELGRRGSWRIAMQVSERGMEAAFETVFHEGVEGGDRTRGTGVEREVNDHCFGESPDIAAFGFRKSIVLISRKSGVSREVDLATWSLVEASPFARAFPCVQQVWYGQPMSLIPHHDDFSELRKMPRFAGWDCMPI
jgi:hypothetical protein